MKLQRAAFITVVAAGTLVLSSGSRFLSIDAGEYHSDNPAFSLLLAVAERTPSSVIPLTVISVIFLSSTTASAAEYYKAEKRFAGSSNEHTDYLAQVSAGGPEVNVVAAMAAKVPKAPGPQDISGTIGVNGFNVLHANLGASQGQHGKAVSAGVQVDIPLSDSSKLSLGARSSEVFPRGAGGQSFHQDHASAALQFNKNLNNGMLTAQAGANFPRGGAAQPFVGLQYQYNF